MSPSPLATRARPHQWTPLDLTGLVAWWDASDTATISVSGHDVSAVSDKSGNSHQLDVISSGGSPQSGLTTQNGLNAITNVPASNSVLRNGHGGGTPSITLSEPYTIVYAGNVGATGGQVIFDNSGAAANALSGSTNWLVSRASNADTGEAIATGLHLFECIYNGASSKMYDNNAQQGGSLNPGAGSMDGLTLTGGRGGTSPANLYLFEVIVTSTELSTTGSELALLNAYLNAKWALY